jgi:glutathione S-transferase
MTALAILGALAIALTAWFLFEKSRRKTHPVKGSLHADITLPHTAEFELYGNAFSHCSRKTRLVMAELGIPYTHKPIDLIETGSYETLSSEYLKINPSGLIPTLVHNGHPVYESDDILTYAAAHARPGAPKLVPDDPEQRARMQTWIEFCNLSSADPTGDMEHRMGSCVPPLTLPLFLTAIRAIPLNRILVGLLFHPQKERPIFFTAGKLLGLKRMLAQKPLQQMMSRGQRHMPTHLARLDGALKESGGPWVLGNQFTLADITLACMLLRIDETGYLERFVRDGDLKAVHAYYDRLRARSSWQAAILNVTHPIIEQAVADLRQTRKADPSVERLLNAGALPA